MLPEQPLYDLWILGGGINGAAIAADAAGRGLSVFLSDKDDFAAHTSSASSKLIHGGLRYLEQGDFRLVREALNEREIMLQKAPHLVQPMQFVLPHAPHLRPAWLIRLGLFLYDHLGKHQTLPGSKTVNLQEATAGIPLKPAYHKGFMYSDCVTQDARLVVAYALEAEQHGAHLHNYTESHSIRRVDGVWEGTCVMRTGEQCQVRSRALINATGPWVRSVLEAVGGQSSAQVRWVKGSHFLLPKWYTRSHAYVLQHTDNRIIFVVPTDANCVLVGTTDVAYQGDLNHIEMDSHERDYLLMVLRTFFKKVPGPEHIRHHFSCVRALFDDATENPSKISREYHLVLEGAEGEAPLLSVFGGKMTTARMLAEHVLQLLRPYFPDMKAPWTHASPLPGGNFLGRTLQSLQKEVAAHYPFVPKEIGRASC